jgi:hypothetical protein
MKYGITVSNGTTALQVAVRCLDRTGELDPGYPKTGGRDKCAAGVEIFDGIKPGNAVLISNVPFQGYEAIFYGRLPGSERVRAC